MSGIIAVAPEAGYVLSKGWELAINISLMAYYSVPNSVRHSWKRIFDILLVTKGKESVSCELLKEVENDILKDLSTEVGLDK